MDLGDILAPGGIIPSLAAASKKLALQELSARASEITGIDTRTILDALMQRERLGSTGLGRGVAIPHVKLKGISHITMLFGRLQKPLDFESHDGEPVDLVFLLLAPDHAGADHLKALARISRIVRDAGTIERLRTASDAAALSRILTIPPKSAAA